jgi:hypothetical protein
VLFILFVFSAILDLSNFLSILFISSSLAFLLKSSGPRAVLFIPILAASLAKLNVFSFLSFFISRSCSLFIASSLSDCVPVRALSFISFI